MIFDLGEMRRYLRNQLLALVAFLALSSWMSMCLFNLSRLSILTPRYLTVLFVGIVSIRLVFGLTVRM